MPLLVDCKNRNVAKNAAVPLVLSFMKNKTLPTPPTSPVISDDKTDNRDPFFCSVVDFRHEEERLKTFEKWPLTFLSPELLARNGFYYLGRGDEVRCAFCKVEIMRWEEGDDPAADHQRWAPQCPFLRNHTSAGNVPADTPPTNGRDECGVRAPPAASVCLPGPEHPKYASEAARISSFKDWPRSIRQKPEDLAEAGFFYTGQGDKTKCFYCDGGLKDWENDDIPWEEHARWFSRCAYLQLVKGKDYVQRVNTEACMINSDETEASGSAAPAAPPAPPATQVPEKEENLIDDSKLCKICYVGERNIVFIPCGHVVACAKCALSTDKCPMCRRTFQNAIRLYYS
ncbi:unnamed protein product [Chilo suppressalis]|uniref:RING-type domain-containing protein n=1 Tax=Chilo suppressalis TaxID=168631 RepID=A0ABN8L566_CHISP|nr:unnamed protein product [Chilo suppressalis]